MFNRQKAYDMRSWYRSRYNSMMESNHPEDRANAYACMLGSQSWEDIGLYMQTDEYPDFDPEMIIIDIQAKWQDYCRTGVAVHDVDQLALHFREEHRKAMQARTKAALDQSRDFAARLEGEPETVKTNQTSSEKRKIQKQSTKSAPEALQSLPEAPAEVIDEKNRYFIQINAIDHVINEIRYELGTERQDAEAAAK